MDKALLTLMPELWWQAVNLAACATACICALWMLFSTMDIGNGRAGILGLRFGMAALAASLLSVCVASLQALFVGGWQHAPTEIMLNVVLASLMVAVWRFHSAMMEKLA